MCKLDPVLTRIGGRQGLGKADRQKTLSVSLAGPFLMRSEDGAKVSISSQMSKKLIAILLRSGNMSRSRSALQTLLWDEFSGDPAANLRQLVKQTRHRLKNFSQHLVAQSGAIMLVNCVDHTHQKHDPHCAFFEDAGFGPEEYEDWLRLERSMFEDLPVLPTNNQESACHLPTVGLFNLHPLEAGSRTHVVTDWVSNLFRDVLSKNDFINFFDLRQEPGTQTDINIEVSVLPIGAHYELSVAVKVKNQCYWSQSELVPSGKELRAYRDTILEFAQISVGAAERCIARLAPRLHGIEGSSSLYEVVSNLFSLSSEQVHSSTAALLSISPQTEVASTLAWSGFAKMLQNGERLVTNRGQILSEAEAYILRALEADPAHPTALAIAAHYYAYVMRDFAKAYELVDQSLRFAPSSPFGHDIRATLDLYCHRLEKAQFHADASARLGRYGPMRHYLAGTGVMLKTLRGQHEHAVRDGAHILRARPRFLPVMRHMSASLAALGRVEEAHDMVQQVRALDPKFATESMKDPNYAIPSVQGRAIIYSALKNKGLHNN